MEPETNNDTLTYLLSFPNPTSARFIKSSLDNQALSIAHITNLRKPLLDIALKLRLTKTIQLLINYAIPDSQTIELFLKQSPKTTTAFFKIHQHAILQTWTPNPKQFKTCLEKVGKNIPEQFYTTIILNMDAINGRFQSLTTFTYATSIDFFKLADLISTKFPLHKHQTVYIDRFSLKQIEFLHQRVFLLINQNNVYKLMDLLSREQHFMHLPQNGYLKRFVTHYFKKGSIRVQASDELSLKLYKHIANIYLTLLPTLLAHTPIPNHIFPIISKFLTG